MSESDQKLPAGFQFAGVACGIKDSGKPDVSLIVADRNVSAGAVYTRNQIVAPPVVLSRSRTPSAAIRAVIANSGNANACTGDRGMQDASEMSERVAQQVGCRPEQVVVMSTGVIGQLLTMDNVRQGIDAAYQELGSELSSFHAAADAICTTDKDRKVSFRNFRCGGNDSDEIQIAGMAKGAGMIAPNMATMLSVICTDATIEPEDAQRLISESAAISFNRVSVDGHTSTNDTLLLLASGTGQPLARDSLQRFADALNDVCIELAKMMVADGEGATHVMAIRVHGADDDAAAEEIARTVAASLLVKTAITGGDPNWGRIVSAAGYAKAHVCPDQTSLKICGTTIYHDGTPLEFDAANLSHRMKSEVDVEIDLKVGSGSGAANFWSSDLTTEYVQFNSEYTT